MNNKITAAIALAVLALMIVPVFAEDSDAAEIRKNDNSYTINSDGGSISFEVYTSTTIEKMTVEVVTSSGDVLVRDSVDLPGGETTKVTVYIGGMRAGDYNITVICESAYFANGQNSFNANLRVNTSIWASWTTWIVIIVIVIVIAILIYFRMRNTARREPEMTFEELEDQRKAEMAAKGAKKSGQSSGSTERQRYLESRRREKE